MSGLDTIDDVNPLEPDNPLAVPLVNTLRELVQTKTAMASLEDTCAGYRLVMQLALHELARMTRETKRQQETICRLREELAASRVGPDGMRTAA